MILFSLLLLPFNFLLPGIGTAATVAVNGWLLGREFFELAALRHMSPSAAQRRSAAPCIRRLGRRAASGGAGGHAVRQFLRPLVRRRLDGPSLQALQP